MLIGTVSIEKSELLSRMMRQRGIPHEVLNAKQHTREAEIVAQAGRLGAVTVATNMAGRGVDIILGGYAEGMAGITTARLYESIFAAPATDDPEDDNPPAIAAAWARSGASASDVQAA